MIKLNSEQLKLLAQFISNLGLVFVVGVITPLFSGSKDVNIFYISTNLLLATICLITSILVLTKVRK